MQSLFLLEDLMLIPKVVLTLQPNFGPTMHMCMPNQTPKPHIPWITLTLLHQHPPSQLGDRVSFSSYLTLI